MHAHHVPVRVYQIDMQPAKEKISNLASAAKERSETYKAEVEEKAEKMTARTGEEKKIAEEKRKAKEAEAKMKLHEAKAKHAAEKLTGAHATGAGAPGRTKLPAYPQGGYSERKLP